MRRAWLLLTPCLGELVYFGNGDFEGLQRSFAGLELARHPEIFGRNLSTVTSLLGYAGSKGEAACYNSSRHYGKLGFVQVAAVVVDGSRAKKQLKALLQSFYGSFQGARGARDRPKPQRKGLQFRSCIGIPGGRQGELFELVNSENAFGMDLRSGSGQDPDAFNVVWIYDSSEFPFIRGEQYLQFVEEDPRPAENWYHGCLRNEQLRRGRIEPTGCPELSAPGTRVAACEASLSAPGPLCRRRGSGHVAPSLRWGITAHQQVGFFTVDEVCCSNHRFAEASGFWMEDEAFASAAEAATRERPLTFYDSVCGAPVFRAPVNRSSEEWLAESRAHGWPSFRSGEAITENLVILPGGEVQSVCGTHLGHNLPDAQGDRFCIDLVCIAGHETARLEKEFQVYFGCGRFNHVQHELVIAEVEELGRGFGEPLTARAAYAGSKASAAGAVCFHNEEHFADYEALGHAEVVQVSCNVSSFPRLARAFLELCPKGSRRDAEDQGNGLRSALGLPGGLRSPLMKELEQAAQEQVQFILGKGADEDNLHQKTIYVYDSNDFPAFLAEEHLQFQDDMTEVTSSALPGLEREEQGSRCPGPASYVPWSTMAIFAAVAAVVLYVARFCLKLDWPFRGQSSLKSGQASLIAEEENYQGMDDETRS